MNRIKYNFDTNVKKIKKENKNPSKWRFKNSEYNELGLEYQ